jgi:hypothetical protein
MMDDYVFLEDVSRRVSEWGQDIGRSGYGTLPGRRGRREMGPGKARKGTSRNKRDILKSQLELRDIGVDLLPPGMERRTLNHSTWDSKYVGTSYLGSAASDDLFFVTTGRGQLF